MKLKTKYILFTACIHCFFLLIAAAIYPYNKYLFVAAEIGILISLLFFIFFYKSLFRPYKLLHAGISSISDQDFGIKFMPVGQKELDSLIEVYNKMMEQLRLERTKNTEKNFFLEKLIEASPAGIIILGLDDRITNINPAALKLMGIPRLSQKLQSFDELPKTWSKELGKIDEQGSRIFQLNGAQQFKCSRSFLIDRGLKKGFFIIEELSRELQKAEWQSYEKVIRMMSHEVNNSVGAANSIIESSLQHFKKQNIIENDIYTEALNTALERLSNLNAFTKRYADLVKLPLPDCSMHHLGELLHNVLMFQQMILRQKNIELSLHLDTEDALIYCDAQQMELVLTNIIKNAIEAVGSNGQININYSIADNSLRIENNGAAIPEALQKRLFEPFFTTKKTGQGIGLTLIREVLSNHSCRFQLKSRQDGITEFSIQFPKNGPRSQNTA